MIAVSAMLLIALAISDISFKEQVLTFFGRDSKTAFYAANSGIECALFHDFGGGVEVCSNFRHRQKAVCPEPFNVQIKLFKRMCHQTRILLSQVFYFNVISEASSCSVVRVTKTAVGVVFRQLLNQEGITTRVMKVGGIPSDPALSDDSARNIERALRMIIITTTIISKCQSTQKS